MCPPHIRLFVAHSLTKKPSPLLGAVHDPPVQDRHLHPRLSDLLGLDGENVVGQDDQVGQLAGDQGAFEVLLA